MSNQAERDLIAEYLRWLIKSVVAEVKRERFEAKEEG